MDTSVHLPVVCLEMGVVHPAKTQWQLSVGNSTGVEEQLDRGQLGSRQSGQSNYTEGLTVTD